MFARSIWTTAIQSFKTTSVSGQPSFLTIRVQLLTRRSSFFPGVQLDVFPNLFTPGNYTGLPLYSVVGCIEMHTNFACEIIKYCLANNLKAASPTHAAVLTWCKYVDELAKDTPIGSAGNCSGYYGIPKADGTESRRIWVGLLPSSLEAVMKYPVWSDYDLVPETRGKRWIIPTPPMPSMLDSGYQNFRVEA